MKHRMKTALLRVLALTIALFIGGYSAAKAAEATKVEVGTVVTDPGTTVSVDVSITNNPGILGTVIKINYDDDLVLKAASAGEAFSPLTMTKPGQYKNGCKFGFDGQDLEADDIKDGTILTLTFEVPADGGAGQEYGIHVTLDSPVDVYLNPVNVTTTPGSIKITGGTSSDAIPESLSATKGVIEYDVGDALAIDDLQVWTVYSDESIQVLESGQYTVDASRIDMSAPGTYDLIINAIVDEEELTTSIPITVNAVLESITAKMAKTTFPAGADIDLSGLTVMAYYTGHSTHKVTDYTTNASQIDMSVIGTKTLEISYTEGGRTVTTSVGIVVKPVLKSLEVSKETTSYELNGTLSLDDLTVKAVYLGQDPKTLSPNDYEVDDSAVDMGRVGTYGLTVGYTEDGVTITEVVTITVNSKLKSLHATKAKTSYLVDEVFSVDDLKVFAIYSGNVSRELQQGEYEVLIEDIDLSAAGEQWFTVSYTEGGKTVTASIGITVSPYVRYISLSKTNIIYGIGDVIDLSDLTVTATYSDDSSAVVTEYETNIDDIDMNTAGQKNLTVTYNQNGNAIIASIPIVVIESSNPEDKYDIADAYVWNIDDEYCTGKPIEPGVIVFYDDELLIDGIDYTVIYSDNTAVGIATVKIYGMGTYTGFTEVTFNILEPFFIDANPADEKNHGAEVNWMGISGISEGWKVAAGREYRGLLNVKRCDFAAFLYRMADLSDDGLRNDSIALNDQELEDTLSRIKDCSIDTPHSAEIAWMVENEISKGWPIGKDGSSVNFRPMANVARQDMAAFLYRYADLQDDGYQNSSLKWGDVEVEFSDVSFSDSANHGNEVGWLASVGVARGWGMKDGTSQFRGTRSVARQDMAAFMKRLYSYL